MSKKALLFINGLKPSKFKLKSNYQLIGCTDGAFNYVKNLNIDLDFILGDLDSISEEDKNNNNEKIILKEDQNKTDFEKALEYLIENNIKKVSVFGATGLENDHFLGNISVALQFKKKIKIIFYDDFGKFFFAKKNTKIKIKKDKLISLFPVGKVKKITTKGLKYSLLNEDLEIGKRIGTRNKSIENPVEITFKKGNLLIFVGK